MRDIDERLGAMRVALRITGQDVRAARAALDAARVAVGLPPLAKAAERKARRPRRAKKQVGPAPNAETLEAMDELERGEGPESPSELIADLERGDEPESVAVEVAIPTEHADIALDAIASMEEESALGALVEQGPIRRRGRKRKALKDSVIATEQE